MGVSACLSVANDLFQTFVVKLSVHKSITDVLALHCMKNDFDFITENSQMKDCSFHRVFYAFVQTFERVSRDGIRIWLKEIVFFFVCRKEKKIHVKEHLRKFDELINAIYKWNFDDIETKQRVFFSSCFCLHEVRN